MTTGRINQIATTPGSTPHSSTTLHEIHTRYYIHVLPCATRSLRPQHGHTRPKGWYNRFHSDRQTASPDAKPLNGPKNAGDAKSLGRWVAPLPVTRSEMRDTRKTRYTHTGRKQAKPSRATTLTPTTLTRRLTHSLPLTYIPYESKQKNRYAR